MDDKEAYILQLENTIKSLEKQVNNLTEIIILLRKQKFEVPVKRPRKVNPMGS